MLAERRFRRIYGAGEDSGTRGSGTADARERIARKWSSSGDEAEECLQSRVYIRINIGEGQIRGGSVLGRLGILDDETFPGPRGKHPQKGNSCTCLFPGLNEAPALFRGRTYCIACQASRWIIRTRASRRKMLITAPHEGTTRKERPVRKGGLYRRHPTPLVARARFPATPIINLILERPHWRRVSDSSSRSFQYTHWPK